MMVRRSIYAFLGVKHIYCMSFWNGLFNFASTHLQSDLDWGVYLKHQDLILSSLGKNAVWVPQASQLQCLLLSCYFISWLRVASNLRNPPPRPLNFIKIDSSSKEGPLAHTKPKPGNAIVRAALTMAFHSGFVWSSNPVQVCFGLP